MSAPPTKSAVAQMSAHSSIGPTTVVEVGAAGGRARRRDGSSGQRHDGSDLLPVDGALDADPPRRGVLARRRGVSVAAHEDVTTGVETPRRTGQGREGLGRAVDRPALDEAGWVEASGAVLVWQVGREGPSRDLLCLPAEADVLREQGVCAIQGQLAAVVAGELGVRAVGGEQAVYVGELGERRGDGPCSVVVVHLVASHVYTHRHSHDLLDPGAPHRWALSMADWRDSA